jgi:hypothetical protein
MRVVNSKITSQLVINIRPHTKFTDEVKYHLDMLPRTCFLPKRLLYFVSGFRNILGEKLLKEGASTGLQTFKKPEGDPVITTFPKVIDCPDIIEILSVIWNEDFVDQMARGENMNIELIMMMTKTFIRKLYPVIYSEEFYFRESQCTASAAGD